VSIPRNCVEMAGACRRAGSFAATRALARRYAIAFGDLPSERRSPAHVLPCETVDLRVRPPARRMRILSRSGVRNRNATTWCVGFGLWSARRADPANAKRTRFEVRSGTGSDVVSGVRRADAVWWIGREGQARQGSRYSGNAVSRRHSRDKPPGADARQTGANAATHGKREGATRRTPPEMPTRTSSGA